MREFELYGGEHQACVRITFNNLARSAIGSDYFLSTYMCLRIMMGPIKKVTMKSNSIKLVPIPIAKLC
jgi:hypothetical protein